MDLCEIICDALLYWYHSLSCRHLTLGLLSGFPQTLCFKVADIL